MRRRDFGLSLLVVVMITIASNLDAADSTPAASRPFLTIFASSVDRIIAVWKTVFDSVGRQDLSASLPDRLKAFRNFAGIDRSKPLGMMTTWDESARAEVIFLPIDDISELLKTATFGVVGYHEAGPGRYEIERGDAPYHVVTRNGYAFFGESVSTILTLQASPEQLTRGWRDRYDLGVRIDLKQIPLPTRSRYFDQLRRQLEPWLQPQDDEPAESARLRNSIGRLVLDSVRRMLLDTNSVTVGGRLDPKARNLSFEVVVDALKGSSLAVSLNQWAGSRTKFAALISPDVPAGLAINLPVNGLMQQILGLAADQKGSRFEAGLQLLGNEKGKLGLILAISGADAIQLNEAIPDLILKLEDSGAFAKVAPSFEIYQGVVFHSLVPKSLPTRITEWIGKDAEIIVGQGKTKVWIGLGGSANLLEQLHNAIDLVEQSPSPGTTTPLLRARFHAKQLPELVKSDLLIPNIDRELSNKAFARGGDGFSVVVEPAEDGIKLRIEAEEGFIRLIGYEWIRQLEPFTQ